MGNPYLDPEFTDNYEVSASINLKAVYLNTSVFYRHTGNSITSLEIHSLHKSKSYGTRKYSCHQNYVRQYR
ncbi:MAG: TonB-dependent receptor [Saprospiraceae bacterium]|nr:TonB-dependent receptor [Saprospiraceae bacterium]